MKKNTWLLIGLIAVIFISGGIAGFFTGRLTAPKRSRKHRKLSHSQKDIKAKIKKHIYKRLKLSDEQKKSTQEIIDNWLDKMGILRQQHAPGYLAVFNDFYAKMIPSLNEEQKKELDKWRNKFTKKGYNNASK